MNAEKNLKEEITKLEKELKELNDLHQKLLKQKKSMAENNEYLQSEIETKRLEILAYNKELSNINKPVTLSSRQKEEAKKEKNNLKETTNLGANLLVKEDSIIKYLQSIQKAYNQSLQVKLKQNIDALTSLQKDMRVSYVIIKKLDITEDYLKLYGLKEELK